VAHRRPPPGLSGEATYSQRSTLQTSGDKRNIPSEQSTSRTTASQHRDSVQPELLFANVDFFGPEIPPPRAEKICTAIQNLKDHKRTREALKSLNEIKQEMPHLAPLIWFSPGCVNVLIQEVILMYPAMNSQRLKPEAADQFLLVLGLLQLLASHDDTRKLFLEANIHSYLIPLITNPIKKSPFSHLIASTLMVFGCLVKSKNTQTIQSLCKTELVPLILKNMRKGYLFSRISAAYILMNILMDDLGLEYICQNLERLFTVAHICRDIIQEMSGFPHVAHDKEVQLLFRHIIRCLLLMTRNQVACVNLPEYIPTVLKNNDGSVVSDEQIRKWIVMLLKTLKINTIS
jgi:CCR4-NOT transcription complex subunit 9